MSDSVWAQNRYRGAALPQPKGGSMSLLACMYADRLIECIVRRGSLGRFGPRVHLASAMLGVDVAQRERRSEVATTVDSVGPWRDQSVLDTSGTLALKASVGPDAPWTCVWCVVCVRDEQ